MSFIKVYLWTYIFVIMYKLKIQKRLKVFLNSFEPTAALGPQFKQTA